MNPSTCRGARAGAGHLFVCPTCRAEARLGAAWRSLPRLDRSEPPVEPDARFVRVVTASVRRDAARRARTRWALAAAAALLFFLCVGTGHEMAGSTGAESSYASLVSPSALEGLIPN